MFCGFVLLLKLFDISYSENIPKSFIIKYVYRLDVDSN